MLMSCSCSHVLCYNCKLFLSPMIIKAFYRIVFKSIYVLGIQISSFAVIMNHVHISCFTFYNLLIYEKVLVFANFHFQICNLGTRSSLIYVISMFRLPFAMLSLILEFLCLCLSYVYDIMFMFKLYIDFRY